MKVTKSFNKLTDAEVERLAIMSEELGEAQRIIGKILRHGYVNGKYDNRKALEKELGDVELATSIMIAYRDVDVAHIHQYSRRTALKICTRLHYNEI